MSRGVRMAWARVWSCGAVFSCLWWGLPTLILIIVVLYRIYTASLIKTVSSLTMATATLAETYS